jgi:hypothetical protein
MVVFVFTFVPSVNKSETSSSSPRLAASMRRFSEVCKNDNKLRDGEFLGVDSPDGEDPLLPVGLEGGD